MSSVDANELLRLSQSLTGGATQSSASVVRNTPNQGLVNNILAAGASVPDEDETDRGFFGSIIPTIQSGLSVALDGLDTLRAATVSTVQEGIDAVQGEGFSLDDWWNQTVHENIGFGDILENETDIDNIWVKRGLGFVGDVVLDPLTYLGGASAVTRLGRTGLADEAFRAGDAALGQKILRGGASSASADDLKFLSGASGQDLKKGLFLNVPFSRRLGDSVGPTQIPVPFTGFASGSTLYDTVASPLRNSRVGGLVSSVLGGRNASAKAIMLNGTPEEAAQAFGTVQTVARQAGRIPAFMGQIEREWAELAGTIDSDETAQLVMESLGGNTTAIRQLDNQLGPGTSDRFRQFSDGLVERGNAHVGAEVFFARNHWQPTQLTDDFAEYLNTASKFENSSLRAGFEREAKLVPGTDFYGTTLVDPKDHVDGLDVRSQVSERVKELQAEFGTEHIAQIFNPDVRVAMRAHLRSYGHAVRKRSIEQDLVSQGIAERLDSSVRDALSFEDAAAAARGDLALDALKSSQRSQSLDQSAAVQKLADDLVGGTDIDGAVVRFDDVSSQLFEARAERFRLTRDQLGSDGSRRLAQVQRRIDSLLDERGQVESLLAANGHDLKALSRLPGGAVGVEPIVSRVSELPQALGDGVRRFRRTGLGYVEDESGLYAFELPHVAQIEGELTPELSDQLAAAGFDGVRSVDGIQPLDASQVQRFGHPESPGFMQQVDDHQQEIRSRVRAHRDVLNDIVDEMGFSPDAQTAALEAAENAAEQNAERLASLGEGAAGPEAVLRRRAERHFSEAKRLAEEGEDIGVQYAARLSAQADAAAAGFSSVLTPDDMLGALKRRDFQETYMVNMRQSMGKLSDLTTAPEHVAETVNGAAKLFEENGSTFFKFLDAGNRAFKTWAIFTPGFHSRNFLGGMANNFLADVDLGRTAEFTKQYVQFRRMVSKGTPIAEAAETIAKNNGRNGEAFAEAVRFGAVGTGGQTSEVADAFEEVGSKLPFLNKPQGFVNNSATRQSFRAASNIEDTLRGTLFMDRIIKGSTPDQALADVAKFHFDYDDLSQAERQIARRVVPFYTWSRKNFPLQLEGMLTRPRLYNRFAHTKRNVELGTEEEQIVPQYVEEALHIRTPFELPGGRAYILPDLPFKELTRTIDPGQVFGSVTPLIKTPIELKFGTKAFQNIPFRSDPQEVPASWPGLGQALDAIGYAEEIDGKFYANDRTLYAVEQAWPVLARLRRTLPSDSDEAFKDRQLTTVLNMTLGLGAFTNTERAMNNELFRREIESRDQRSYEAALAELAG